MKADERRLEAFHMNCQRRILGIHWFHFVTNASVTQVKHLNWRRRHGIPDSPEATLRLWPCTPTPRSDTSPLRATPGRGHSSRLQTRQQTGVETPMGALKMQDRKMTDKSQVVKNYSTAVYPTPHPSATTSRRILFYLSI